MAKEDASKCKVRTRTSLGASATFLSTTFSYHKQPSGASKSNAPYPPQSTARPKPTPKPAPKPPVESKKETEKKVAENKEKIRAAKEKGFPIMPKAENSTTFTVTDMGWVDPLELYYGAVADELQKLCAGHSSVGSYGQSRCNFHKKHFGVSRMAEEFLRLRRSTPSTSWSTSSLPPMP